MKTMHDGVESEITPWIIVKEKLRPIMEYFWGSLSTFNLDHLTDEKKQEFLDILCAEGKFQNGVGRKINGSMYEVMLTLTVKKVE